MALFSGEKKFKLSDLRNFVKTNELVVLSKSSKLPETDPEDPIFDSDVVKPSVPLVEKYSM